MTTKSTVEGQATLCDLSPKDKKEVSLRRWFAKNTFYPLAILVAFLFVLQIVIGGMTVMTSISERERAIERLGDVATRGVAQKNRVILEELVSLGVSRLGASSVSICKESRPLFAIPSSMEACRLDGGLFSQNVRVNIEGFEGHFLLAKFDSKDIIVASFWQSLVLLLPVALLWLLLVRLRSKIDTQLVLPFAHSDPNRTAILEIRKSLRQQEEVLQLQKRFFVEQALTKFAKQVMHDIRSPVTALEIISRDVGSSLDADKARLFSNALGRVKEIADSLLEKSKLGGKRNRGEQSKNGPEVAIDNCPTNNRMERLEVQELVRNLTEEKRNEYADLKELNIELSMQRGSQVVEANRIEFQRVVSNLVNNAVESLEGHSGFVTINVETFGHYVVLEVRDNGCGIPGANLEKVFGEGVSIDKPQGSGLGLSHARNQVEKWGGEISIFSKIDVGTTVSLKVPLAEAESIELESI